MRALERGKGRRTVLSVTGGRAQPPDGQGEETGPAPQRARSPLCPRGPIQPQRPLSQHLSTRAKAQTGRDAEGIRKKRKH